MPTQKKLKQNFLWIRKHLKKPLNHQNKKTKKSAKIVITILNIQTMMIIIGSKTSMGSLLNAQKSMPNKELQKLEELLSTSNSRKIN